MYIKTGLLRLNIIAEIQREVLNFFQSCKIYRVFKHLVKYIIHNTVFFHLFFNMAIYILPYMVNFICVY